MFCKQNFGYQAQAQPEDIGKVVNSASALESGFRVLTQGVNNVRSRFQVKNLRSKGPMQEGVGRNRILLYRKCLRFGIHLGRESRGVETKRGVEKELSRPAE